MFENIYGETVSKHHKIESCFKEINIISKIFKNIKNNSHMYFVQLIREFSNNRLKIQYQFHTKGSI